jgi:hypothetical protein
VWRSFGRAGALRAPRGGIPLMLLTTDLPRRSSDGDNALRAAGPDVVFDVIGLYSRDHLSRLGLFAAGGHRSKPAQGYLDQRDLS